MKLCTLLFVAFASAAPLTAAQMQKLGPMHKPMAPAGPTILVLLEKDAPSAFVDAKGSYQVICKENGQYLSSGVYGKRFMMHALQQGLRWGEEYPDTFQISVIPTHPHSTISVNGIQYKGIITVYHVRDNNITIVNEVPIEDFLKSTLGTQYEGQSVSGEAMAALTILARTEAYTKITNRKNNSHPWDVSAREVGYFGRGISQPTTTDLAVDATRYMVLESLKDRSPIQNPYLSPTKADELAQKGMDAQKILKSVFPAAKIGATISPDEVAIR